MSQGRERPRGERMADVWRRLLLGPASNQELQDIMIIHSGDVARTMCTERDRGFVLNLQPGKGRMARWALTERGRALANRRVALFAGHA